MGGLFLLPPFLPLIAMWLEIDYIFLGFRHVIPRMSIPTKIMFQSIRVIFSFWSVVECASSVKLLFLQLVMALRGLECCHKFIGLQPVKNKTFNFHRQLALFSVVREGLTFMISPNLAIMYVIQTVCTAATVNGVTALAWHLHFFVALMGFVCGFGVAIVLHLLVMVDLESSRLQQGWWNLFAAQSESERWQRRLIQRTLKSIKPIRIPYGTLGAFKKATRTDFIDSLTNSCSDCILAWRSEFM